MSAEDRTRLVSIRAGHRGWTTTLLRKAAEGIASLAGQRSFGRQPLEEVKQVRIALAAKLEKLAEPDEIILALTNEEGEIEREVQRASELQFDGQVRLSEIDEALRMYEESLQELATSTPRRPPAIFKRESPVMAELYQQLQSLHINPDMPGQRDQGMVPSEPDNDR